MLPQLEETSPQVILSLVTATKRTELREIIVTLHRKNRGITVKVETETLLLPGGKLDVTLSQWKCKETFGIKIKSSMLPPPTGRRGGGGVEGPMCIGRGYRVYTHPAKREPHW